MWNNKIAGLVAIEIYEVNFKFLTTPLSCRSSRPEKPLNGCTYGRELFVKFYE